ncbi:sugar kinase [Desulfofundulus thermosubterraneus]|uniref:5-dehydro-2-deoxygluconokinase n=1 Tax=Desulfofundulus thermosubterraneus DSM 16057 TaxID=1121432 RepID=A0A1M6M5A0_9FIRM|nr:sugar kinase [Desulfofundulus thermosubterraneus]SHJ78654.1 5-dehydro-2-deoxygluconokinase [Desulfofundulus thermosubterraneus DSM 16057]
MPEVVTLGETMVLMNPDSSGPLKYVTRFTKQIGGAESNFAIGVVRLGHGAGWISRVGNDEFGKYIVAFIRGEGVDTSQVKFDPDAPTGLYFKERREYGESKVYYYRRGSAASRLSPEDLDPDYIGSAKFLHVTGITPALSESCYRTVKEAIKIAKSRGVKVSLDPNIRLKLWSKERAREVIMELAAQSDIILPGLSEGAILVGEREPEKIAAKFLDQGIETVVVKLGKEGAYFASGSESKFVPGYPIERVVDPIGAGDGFAAGFIAGLLKGYSIEESVKLANAVGALATTVTGDVEGLPTMDEVAVFQGKKEGVDR